MSVTHPNYPCVNEAIRQVNMVIFRRGVVSQHDLDMPINKHTAAEIEIAKNFDVSIRLRKALRTR